MRLPIALGAALVALACRGNARHDPGKSDAQALVDEWVTAINTGKGATAVAQLIAPDYVWHLPGGNVRGRDAVQKIFADMFTKCPQLKTTAEHVLTDGEFVVVRWTESCSPSVPSTSDITIDRFGHGQFLEGWEVDSDKPWIP
jgi:uncharacterized protein (TIGR02246 family)